MKTLVFLVLAFCCYCVVNADDVITSTGFPTITSFKCFGVELGGKTSTRDQTEVDVCLVGVISAVVILIGIYPFLDTAASSGMCVL